MSTNQEISNLTKSYIKTAMLELLSKQRYDKISITDLVARAGVSRTAFYRNYSSKDDLIEDIVHDLIESTNIDIQIFLNYNVKELETFYNCLRSKKKEIEIITKASLENLHILNHKKDLACEIIKRNIEKQYEDAAIGGAINAIVYKWILENMNETDEEMAKITYKIIHK